jgi:two-component system chemotaxis response regulator CheB
MIVDDSATVRTVLKMILEKDPDIIVIGVAPNPDIALKKMQREWPDVIVSDLEMPGMHGLDFLRYLKENHPTPFVVCSSHVGPGAQASLDALALGAVDIIAKPNIGVESFLEDITAAITQSVKAAAQSKTARVYGASNKIDTVRATLPLFQQRKASSVIAVGSSTGGTTVVEYLLKSLTPQMPGVVIVQHMPKHFTELFAKRLNNICTIEVREAVDGDVITPGLALIAPGGAHMKVQNFNNKLQVRILDEAPVNRHRPSVDVLFRSVAEAVGNKSIGIILTGMGEDGAQGLLAMRKAGAVTIGQDQASSAVYGMPRAAMEIGAVECQLPFTAIPDLIKQSLPSS